MSPVIQVEGLRFKRGAQNGDFHLGVKKWSVPAGTSVALVGPSGCGKTTLLHLLAGILVPDAGQLMVAGEQLHDSSDEQRRAFRRERVGLVFQEARLVPHLSVRDNILILHHRRLLSRLPSKSIARCAALAERVGISHLLQRRADRLSRGEAQRAALARALFHEPTLILADEPTASLDAASAQQIISLLEELRTEQNATLVVASHDPRCIESCAEHCDLPTLLGNSELAGAKDKA